MSSDRERIIGALTAGLQSDPSVHALWLEGSVARGTADDLSDVDLWLDVDDALLDTALKKVEAILARLGQLDLSIERAHPHPLIRQAFFHLAGTSQALLIDVCVEAHRRVWWFTREHVDEKPLVLFDKSGVIRFEDLDEAKLAADLRARIDTLQADFVLFQIWLSKSLRRGSFLESLAYYQGHILPALVELLRIRYQPTKREFYLKHVESDLPAEIVRQLEQLYRVASLDDIAARASRASGLFAETLDALTPLAGTRVDDAEGAPTE